MCTSSQAIHANHPPKRTRPISQIALRRPIVAIWPRSTYRNDSRGLPRRSRRTARAKNRPCCIATGAWPGSGGRPESGRKWAWSPATKTSGWPGRLRSADTITRPCASRGTPRVRFNAEGSTPAAHNAVDVSIRSRPTSTHSASIRVTGLAVHTWTPRPSRSRVARLAWLSRKDGRMRGPASTRITRVSLGSMLRKSRASVNRLISPRAPASSTPVGPPPTTTKVSSARRRAGSTSRSASSKAVSTRRRISVACSRVFSPGACSSQSSWPKYA